MENKALKASDVLIKLQEMGDVTWISHQRKIGREKEETLMYHGETTGQRTDTYKGSKACYWCGSKEHKKFECPEFLAGKDRTAGFNGIKKWNGKSGKGGKGGGGGGNNSSSKKEVTTCGICKKKGHKDDKCFGKAEMADKRPKNWESCLTEEKRTELGLSSLDCLELEAGFVSVSKEENSSMSGEFDFSGAEFHCMAMENKRKSRVEEELCDLENEIIGGAVDSPDNMKLLYSSDYWVFDSGATSSCTGDNTGMVNVSKLEGVSSVASNGSSVHQSENGDIPVEKLDKNGEHCNYTVLKDVQYGTSNRFNLFAVNRMLEQGWEARGKKEGGWSLT